MILFQPGDLISLPPLGRMPARSYNPVFSQFLVQGGPADAEHPGRTGTVALRLFKGPEKQQFFLLLRNGGGFLPSDGEVEAQLLR